MKIESYDFGTITIADNTFTKDIIVCDGWLFPNWRRKAGHLLHFDDIKPLWEYMQPDLIIIGTGKHGMLEVPDSVVETIRKLKTQVYWDKTDNAVGYYNDDEYKGIIVMGCFHLTC